MKSRRTWIGVSLLVLGLVCISIPLYYEWEKNKEMRALEEALSLLSSADGDVDLSKVSNLSLTESELRDVIVLEIPSIELKQNVLNETTDENLSIALTQLKKDQKLGEGNFSIAGHRGYRGKRHFSQLPQVEVGDKAYLYEGNKKYVYQINSSKVIQPSDVDILDDHENREELTLITCTVTGQERIAVQGELIEITDQNKNKD